MATASFNVRDREGRKQTVGVLAVDEHLIVVEKPAGLLVIPDHWNPDKPNLRDLAAHLVLPLAALVATAGGRRCAHP